MRVKLVATALGEAPADLVLRGGRVVNVHTGEVLRADVAVKGNRIALVGDVGHCVGRRTRVIEVFDRYVVPGLIDAHVHVESSMVTVTEFARAVLPRGTTAVFVDPHELANVLGLRGIKLMLQESKGLPLRVFVTLPSCVPSAPGLETTGAELGQAEVAEGLRWKRVVGLGEVMNFPGVLAGDEKMHGEISEALKRRLAVEGHAPGLLGKELSAYVAAGVQSDHESSTPEEAVEKLRLGMKLELREGSAAKNIARLLKPIKELGLDTRHCLFATDDRHPADLVKEGHMDHVVRRAIEEGLDPIKAVQMATLNPAEHFGLGEELGSISPGKLADVVVVKDLRRFKAEYVVANGELVASRGKLLFNLPPPRPPRFALRTVKARRVSPSDFKIKAPPGATRVRARVIEVVEGEIFTKHKLEWVEVEGGLLKPDPSRDLLEVAVVERHRRTGRVGLGLVRGFGLKRGALASSVAHDAHNLVAAGASGEELALAINELRGMQGGQVVVAGGRVLARVRLPLAGLMSLEPVERVAAELGRLHQAAKNLGVKLRAPFASLSFLSLPVVPELKITDKGLVDVKQMELVNLIVDQKS